LGLLIFPECSGSYRLSLLADSDLVADDTTASRATAGAYRISFQ
jgi:hypothetical protein